MLESLFLVVYLQYAKREYHVTKRQFTSNKRIF